MWAGSSMGSSSCRPMKVASTSRAARAAWPRVIPEAARWPASAPSHTSLASATTEANGSAPEDAERGGLDVEPLAAGQAGVLTAAQRSSTARRTPELGGSARMAATDRSLETRSTVATRSSLSAKW